MRKKDNVKLDAISRIDGEIIERNTLRRILLLGRASRKRSPKKIIILAAAILLIASITVGTMIALFGGDNGIIPGGDGRQVPIYEGMTLSKTKPNADATLLLDAYPDIYRYSMLYNGHKPPHLDDKPMHEVGESLFGVAGGAKDIFYAKPNTDFYITVHINNPDNFEILSFTLNGEKYSSYMFEQGSDMENLILKCNPGDAEGLVEYTIDAIKYVDGTEIKDVRMEGDRTVKVGVYSEKQPTSTVTDEIIGFNDIRFNVSVSDEIGLIEQSGGQIFAFVYDGENVVSSAELKVGENNALKLDSLRTGCVYKYAIIAKYDAFDGNGFDSYTLYEKTFETNSIITFTSVSTTKISATFSLDWHDNAHQREIVAITLYRGEEKVGEIDKNATSVDGLLSGVEYRLVVECLNGESVESIEQSFTTGAYSVPSITVTGSATQTALSFALNETDVDNRGEISKIELIHGNDITAAASTDVRSFEDLISDNEYTVRVAYVYDLNDGNGEQTITTEWTTNTLAKSAPEVSLSNNNFAKTSVSFYLHMSDKDDTGKIEKIELYNGEKKIKDAANVDIRSFTGLEVLNTYTVKVTYSYDLNDGNGKHTETKQINISTQSSGLAVSGGYVTGIGSCTDSEVYINMPVRENSFSDNSSIITLHLGKDSAIYSYSFVSCGALTDVIIYDGVNKISDRAFYNCGELVSVDMPDSVTSIEELAFYRCYSLKNIELPQNLTELGDNTFYECESLERVVVPNGITTLNNGVFSRCKSLKDVTLSNSLTSIMGDAFFGCSSLTEIELPETLKSIRSWAFQNCSGLKEIVLPDGLTTIDGSAFSGCNFEIVTIPDSVITMGENAFANCGRPTIYAEAPSKPSGWHRKWNDGNFVIWDVKDFVTDEQGITYAVHSDGTRTAASFDDSVTDVVIPEGVVDIGIAFAHSNISSIALPESLTYIADYAFYNCQVLIEVNIPDGVTSIGSYAFQDCYNLGKLGCIYIPDSVTSIHDGAFSYCNTLTKIFIPASVTYMGENVFDEYVGCAIYAEAESKPSGWDSNWLSSESCTVVWGVEFTTDSQGITCVVNNDGTMTVFEFDGSVTDIVLAEGVVNIGNVFSGSNITSIVLPKSLTTISESAFAHCYDLKTVTFNGQITSIGGWAFQFCQALKEITIPNSVTSIGESAFDRCSALESIVLPDSVTSIGNYAFSSCSALTSIIIPRSVTHMGNYVFSGRNLVVYAEIASRPLGWSENWILKPINYTIPVVWNFKELTTDSQGITYVVHNDGTTTVFSFDGSVADIVVPEGVVDIGTAFANSNIASIVLPNSLTSIGEYAFLACYSLETIVIPDRVGIPNLHPLKNNGVL